MENEKKLKVKFKSNKTSLKKMKKVISGFIANLYYICKKVKLKCKE